MVATKIGRYKTMSRIFSHQDTQESAEEIKLRVSQGKPISKEEFERVSGAVELLNLENEIGVSEKYFQSEQSMIGPCVYTSIGNIDYVFYDYFYYENDAVNTQGVDQIDHNCHSGEMQHRCYGYTLVIGDNSKSIVIVPLYSRTAYRAIFKLQGVICGDRESATLMAEYLIKDSTVLMQKPVTTKFKWFSGVYSYGIEKLGDAQEKTVQMDGKKFAKPFMNFFLLKTVKWSLNSRIM